MANDGKRQIAARALISGRLMKVDEGLRNWFWRRGRDSNPRYACAYSAFRVRRDRPLCHLSGADSDGFKSRRKVGGAISTTRTRRQGVSPHGMTHPRTEGSLLPSTASMATCASSGKDSPNFRASSGLEAFPSSARL
jgi:hypothetical protein